MPFGSSTDLASCGDRRLLIRDAKTAPYPARPQAPPNERMNWASALATPMSRPSTAFCTAVVVVGIVMPMPSPITTCTADTYHRCVSTASRVNSSTATNAKPSPTTGKIL